MSELSSALGGSAPKHHITGPDGKRYPVGLITQNVRIAYEKALFEKAKAVLGGMRSLYDREAYHARLDLLGERYTSGEFALEREFAQKSLRKPGGAVLLLSFMMGTTISKPNGETDIIPFPEWELMQLAAAVPEEIGNVMRVVMKESFPNMNLDKLEAEEAAREASQETPSPN